MEKERKTRGLSLSQQTIGLVTRIGKPFFPENIHSKREE